MTSNNSTTFPSSNKEQSDSFDDPNLKPIYIYLSFTTSIVFAVSSFVAVAGNFLTVVAIWRKEALRTPSFALLGGLALTDFCTGLITKPLYVAYKLTNLMVNKKYTIWLCVNPVVQFFALYFGWLTLLIMTLMSIERWLYMARSSLLTVHRVIVVLGLLVLLPIPISVTPLLSHSRENECVPNVAEIVMECISLLCCVAISVAYFKVFKIIRSHQNQVQANHSSQNFGQPAIDVLKYKKSVFTILYILALYYCCFLPVTSLYLLSSVVKFNSKIRFAASEMSVALFLISSSLNPFLYFWRIGDLRNEVKRLIRTKILCKKN